MRKLILVSLVSIWSTILAINQLLAQVDFSMKVQQGHTSAVSDADLSSDGKYLVSTGLDDQSIIWDMKTGREIVSLPGSDVVTVFPDSKKFMVRGTQKGKMDIRALPSGRLLETFDTDNELYWSFLKISPDAKYFITSELNLYDINTKEKVRGFSTSDVNWDLAFSPDGKSMLVGTRGDLAKLFDLETGNVIKTFNHDPGGTYRVAFSWDGKYVFTANSNIAKQWNLSTGTLIRTYTVKGDVDGLVCSPDNQSLLIGSFTGIATLFNLSSGVLIRKFGNSREQTGGWADFYPDGKRIVVDNGGENTMVADFKIWKIDDNKKPLKSLSGNISNLYTTYTDQRNPMRFLSLSGPFKNQSINVWDLEKGKITNSYDFKLDYQNLQNIDFRRDTIQALIAKKEDVYVTHDVVRRKVIREYNYAAFLPSFYILNDRIMVVVKKQKEYPNAFIGLDVIDLRSNKVAYSLAADKFVGIPSSFSQNGQYAIIYDENYMPYLYDLPNARLIRKIEKPENTMYSFEGNYLRETGNYNKSTADYKLYSLPFMDLVFSGDYQLSNTTMNARLSHYQNLAATTTQYGRNLKIWDVNRNVLIDEVKVPTEANNLRFSTDDKLLLVAGKYVYDIPNRRYLPLKGDYYYHGFSADGRYLISSGRTTDRDDKSVKVFHRLSDGEVMFTIVGINGNNSDYVIYTPDGYYSTTRKANENIHYVKDGQVYLFDQFDFYFNRPDIVLERMGYANTKLIESYRKAYEKRRVKMGIIKTDVTLNELFNVPELVITSNMTLGAVTNKMYELSLKASDQQFPITQLNVWINNVPLYGKDGLKIDMISNTLEKSLGIELGAGVNKIEVSVINQIGVESLKESFSLRYDHAVAVKPDLYLVSIGVSKFTDDTYNLNYAAKDANDIAKLYKSRIDLFNKIHLITLTDTMATRERIAELKEKLLNSRPDDLVILFIATHGLLDQNLDYFLATNDVNFENPTPKGLGYDAFESLIDSIPSRKRLLFMDACNSGEVDKEEVLLVDSRSDGVTGVKSRGFKQLVDKVEGIGLENSFELMLTMFNDLRRGSGAVVLSSASGKEFAYESAEWNNGVFTFALLEGLKTKKADLDKDTHITVSELKTYVTQRVEDLTYGKQHPISRKENLENDFVVW